MLCGRPYFFKILLISFNPAALFRFAVTAACELHLYGSVERRAELTVDLREQLIQMLATLRIAARVRDASVADLGGNIGRNRRRLVGHLPIRAGSALCEAIRRQAVHARVCEWFVEPFLIESNASVAGTVWA
jgi:hypothetical protein